MLDAERLVELNGLGYEVSVELIEVAIEQGREVLWQVVGFLETRSEAIGERGDVWHMVIFADLGFLFDIVLKLSLPVCV